MPPPFPDKIFVETQVLILGATLPFCNLLFGYLFVLVILRDCLNTATVRGKTIISPILSQFTHSSTKHHDHLHNGALHFTLIIMIATFTTFALTRGAASPTSAWPPNQREHKTPKYFWSSALSYLCAIVLFLFYIQESHRLLPLKTLVVVYIIQKLHLICYY